MQAHIKGKTALITGSSRGVRQQIALGLARLGCNLIVHGTSAQSSRTTLKLLQDYPISVNSVYSDLTSMQGVNELIRQVTNLEVNVDILYNNAAIMTDYHEDIWSHTEDEWNKTMQVNVIALYNLCGAFIPRMVANGFGRVVNLVSGIENLPELAPYSASKWAVLKLSQDLGFKYRDTNVRINVLDPGWLQTDMGGDNAPNKVTDVLPGALEPVLVNNSGSTGKVFRALDYKAS